MTEFTGDVPPPWLQAPGSEQLEEPAAQEIPAFEPELSAGAEAGAVPAGLPSESARQEFPDAPWPGAGPGEFGPVHPAAPPPLPMNHGAYQGFPAPQQPYAAPPVPVPNQYGPPAGYVPQAPGAPMMPSIPPHGAGPQPTAAPPGLEASRLVPTAARRTPGGGWRKTLHTVSGGLITFGASKSQQQLDLMIHRVRQPVHGDFRLAVLSIKGGVGKTTTTLGLGSAFASLRGDRVIAVDANPDFGTLASRIPEQCQSTVRDLLNDPAVARYTDVRRHTSQAASRLEILASERDPAISEAFTADEYRRVVGVLENYYNIIMTDCGTGLMHSAMEGVLSMANAIVVVTSPAVDGAQSASATLDWLTAHGYERLVREAVVVISASKPGGAPIDLELLTRHFLGRSRAVQIIPYDDHLAAGAYVDLDQMHRRTRTAFLELAATVADSFTPPAAQVPNPAWGPDTQPRTY